MYNVYVSILTANKQSTMTTKHYAAFAIILALGLGYIVWLDSGCSLSGAMTWHGKVCVENL